MCLVTRDGCGPSQKVPQTGDLRGKRKPKVAGSDSLHSRICKRKWLYASGRKDGVIPRKRAKVDLFSTPGRSWKKEGKPESEDPLGMAESLEGLESVARAEVKVPKKCTGKVSVRHALMPLFPTL